MRPYSYLMSASGSGDGHYVELLETKFLELLRYLLVQVEVDEDWYLASYADVREAVEAGQLASARSHYVIAGYFENRLPRQFRVDEDWYLASYPDVAEAIRSGAFTSVAEHFERDGFREGRLAHPQWSLLGEKVSIQLF
jgi:hypothetical protein